MRTGDGGLQADARRPRLRLATLRRPAQFVMLLVAIAMMLDGWLGPQIAPLNLAGVLPWIHWRALSLLALLIVGNLFCMSCPFTLVRDGWRKLLPPILRWPRRLRSKWLSAVLLLLYLWAYEAFGLWNSPWLTAWIIAGYFLSALVIDGLFRGASFCKYVCPIGQFQFVTSLLSPAEIRVKKNQVCSSCRTYDCIRGNERQRGCELQLFQPKKSGNLDCTFCLDCVKACPHDNVALLPVIPAQTLATTNLQRSSIGKLAKRTDFAVLALVLICGAFANAAGMTGPVMMWEQRWHARLGPHAMPWIVGAFTLLVTLIVPALAIALCGALNRLVTIRVKWPDLLRQLVMAAIPLGVGMWAAHLLYHFATSWSAALPAIARVASGISVAAAPMASIPGWLTAAQILLLDAGLLAALYLSWHAALSAGETRKPAIAILLPWGLCFSGLYLAGAWILFQPMPMRGMMMH